jgi:acyl carrier protein
MTQSRPPALEPDAVLEAVVRILEQVSRRPQPGCAMDTELHALDGVDSLRLLETVALAEEQFDVMVETGGLGQIETVGDIVRLVMAGRRD